MKSQVILRLSLLVWVCLGAISSYADEAPGGVAIKLSKREYSFLENRVCHANAEVAAAKIKAYKFAATAGGDGKLALAKRTSAYVECEAHGQFNGRPMRYVDDCDLIEGEWDCSPPQLEVVSSVKGREIRLRPWSMPPEEADVLLQKVGTIAYFQGESIDEALGDSCDIAKTKDPEVVELGCKATMAISFWCPQIQKTGCPRMLYLSFEEPYFKRRRHEQ